MVANEALWVICSLISNSKYRNPRQATATAQDLANVECLCVHSDGSYSWRILMASNQLVMAWPAFLYEISCPDFALLPCLSKRPQTTWRRSGCSWPPGTWGLPAARQYASVPFPLRAVCLPFEGGRSWRIELHLVFMPMSLNVAARCLFLTRYAEDVELNVSLSCSLLVNENTRIECSVLLVSSGHFFSSLSR